MKRIFTLLFLVIMVSCKKNEEVIKEEPYYKGWFGQIQPNGVLYNIIINRSQEVDRVELYRNGKFVNSVKVTTGQPSILDTVIYPRGRDSVYHAVIYGKKTETSPQLKF